MVRTGGNRIPNETCPTELARTGRPYRTRRSQHVRTARGRGLKNADTDIPLRIHRRSGADRRGRMAGSPFRQQSHRRQYPTRRMPRLAVIDAAAVDGRRRLVLVRRDNVEHLLMIGGPTDIVVEPNIVRAMPGREALPQRPPGTELPPRIAPLPDAAGWSDDAVHPEPHVEPQMPEPP